MISDDEDDDETKFQREIERAIEASKSSRSTPGTESVGSSAMQVQEPPSAFMSERAIMERERLARQKRLRKEAGLDDEDDLSAKRQHLPSEGSSSLPSSPEIPSKGKSKATHSATSTNVPTIDQIFWEGEVRQIANKHAEPREDGRPTFRLTEILGKVCRCALPILVLC